MHLEDGYDTYLHERGMNLSVGQRQLICFARAILARPRILILDEATANVDTQTEAVIQRALKTLLAGRTSFVIAHRLSTIRNADRIVVLEHGRIVEQGKHDDLLALDGLYANLYRMTYEQHALGAAGADGNGAKATNGSGNGHGPRSSRRLSRRGRRSSQFSPMSLSRPTTRSWRFMTSRTASRTPGT